MNVGNMEDQLQKASLFKVFDKGKATEQKITELQQLLDLDADVNSSIGKKNNTLLHVAVVRGEIEIVKILLERGADSVKKNVDNKTALDLALSVNMPNKQAIINILATKNESNKNTSERLDKSDDKNSSSSNNYIDATSKEIQSVNSNYLYKKRFGTSGIGGQLYETKLLSLFLLRALNKKEIISFNLATNIEGIGAFDDVALQYETRSTDRPKVVFIQAKHKENLKNKITIPTLFREHEDFSLHKYFDSYLKIKRKFNTDKNDDIFKYEFKNVDCDFIIYTVAMENFGNKKLFIEDNSMNKALLHTSKTGDVFRLDFSDEEVEHLLGTVLEIRTQQLGESFMKFLFKDNHQNLLMDQLIKTYHVFLGQNVVEITVETENNISFLEGKFRSTFIDSKDEYLIMLKDTIYKEFSAKYKTNSLDRIEQLVKSFSFKLPLSFGNINFNIGSGAKLERRLSYICSKIKQLIDSADSSGTCVIKIYDSMVGPEMILQQTDLEMYRLGGLVGNLLILNKKTCMLEFNKSIESLPPVIKRLWTLLKNEYPDGTDFNKYRFDIQTWQLPKLLLGRNEYDLKLVKEFLNTIIFYTNQACEDDVEKTLKREITKCYELTSIKDNLQRRMKCESIFLKVHDSIQKWWKQPIESLYLDKKCKFYDEAKEQLFSYTLLNTFHFLYTTKLNSYGVQFNKFDDEFVTLNTSEPGIINIVTNNVILSSIKLMQYLNHNSHRYTPYMFLNLDFIASEKCLDEVIMELKEVKLYTIIITCDNNDLYDSVVDILEQLQVFVFVVTKKGLRDVICSLNTMNYVKICDQNIAFIDLSEESQEKVLEEYKVIFQGSAVLLKLLVNNIIEIIDSVALIAILNKEIIHIGLELSSPKFKDIEDCYIEREICRFVTLKTNVSSDLYIINNTDGIQEIPEDKHEIIVISNKKEDYVIYCDRYGDKNIHWFVNDRGHCVWQKSRGSLNVISEHVDKGDCQQQSYRPQTLLDIGEKVIILYAGPGMGKSSLVSHLSIQTKNENACYWILRINCLDYKNLFSCWQEEGTVIDLKEMIKFLYMASLKIVNADDFNFLIGPHGDISIVNTGDRKLVGFAYLEVELFNMFYNNGQIVIICDGVDEISPDYLKVVIDLLKVLGTSKVRCLWVTTRPYNLVNNLEHTLGTFGYTIEKLSLNSQNELLAKMLGKLTDEKPNITLKEYAIKYLNIFRQAHRGLERDFTSVPLHICLLAKICPENLINKYEASSDKFMVLPVVDLFTMYEKFVNIKFYSILFGEKKPYYSDKDPDMKEMIEMKRRKFIATHKKLAAHLLFSKTVDGLFSQRDKVKICKALEIMRTAEERTGIIDTVIEEEPQFVHITFAEYFAIEYLCDKLKHEECSTGVWIYFFDTILAADEFQNFRTYFDLKLKSDTCLNKLPEDLKCKQEVFNTLVKQNGQNSLYRALVEVYLKRNALFILQCINGVLTKNNLSDFINYVRNAIDDFVSYEIRKKNILYSNDSMVRWCVCQEVLYVVFGFVKDIDSSIFSDLFVSRDALLFNVFGISVSYLYIGGAYKDLFDIMLTSVENIDLTLKLFTMSYNVIRYKTTIVHTTVKLYQSVRTLTKYLLRFNKEQRMKIFKTFDAEGYLAAHLAAARPDLDFFVVLASLLDVDRFINICNTYDRQGNTPIDYLLTSVSSYIVKNNLQYCVAINIKRWCANGVLRLTRKEISDKSYYSLEFEGHTSLPLLRDLDFYYAHYLYELLHIVHKRKVSYRPGKYFSSVFGKKCLQNRRKH